jgi:hypothetical protein
MRRGSANGEALVDHRRLLRSELPEPWRGRVVADARSRLESGGVMCRAGLTRSWPKCGLEVGVLSNWRRSSPSVEGAPLGETEAWGARERNRDR